MVKNKETNEGSNGFAIASLATSIIGLVGFIMPYLAIVPSILGVVFASLQKKHGGPNGMATAGLVMGILGIIGNIFWICLIVIALMIGAV